MNIKPIKSKKDYQAAIARLEQIFDIKPGSNEGDELEILGILIEKYSRSTTRLLKSPKYCKFVL